jgi:signal transduction histidine kinase
VEVVAAPEGTQTPAFLALMLATYSLGAHARLAPFVAGFVISVLGVGAAQLVAPEVAGYSHTAAISFFVAVLVVAPLAIGGVVRLQSHLGRRVRAGTEISRAQGVGHIDNRRAEQRQRISADIERVVLSGLEAMRPHAEVGDLGDVTAVRDLGRDILSRMRGLLGQLRRSGDEHESPREPGRGLPDLQAQVYRMLAAGADGIPARPARRALWSLVTSARVDLVLAIAGGVYALLVVGATIDGPAPIARRIAACATGAAAALAVIGVRRRPLVMTTVSMAAVIAYAGLDPRPDELAGWVAGLDLIVFPFVVGAALELTAATVGLALCVATAGVTVVFSTAATSWVDLSSFGLSAGAWVAGRVLRAGARALATDVRAGTAEEMRQRAALRKALDADRARVARDLHDAIGHAMTGIVLQATAAVRVWQSQPTLAQEHKAALRRTLGEALNDLRPLVTTVAIDGGAHAPGLHGVAALVDRARLVGLRVGIVGAAPAVDSTVDAVAYRIVQEALTNAARYAPGATVTIRFTTLPRATAGGWFAVEVGNGAPPHGVTESSLHSGHGLPGMAERVANCGGTFDAAPTPDGGFRVLAVLPRTLDGVA